MYTAVRGTTERRVYSKVTGLTPEQRHAIIHTLVSRHFILDATLGWMEDQKKIWDETMQIGRAMGERLKLKMENKLTSEQQLEQLTQEAKTLGATSAAIISSKEIQVKDHLAALCNGEYSCPNYGLAASCPPYVGGPTEFRKWQAQSKYSITVKNRVADIRHVF